MRIPLLALSLLFHISVVYSDAQQPFNNAGGLYPPGLLPIINRANALLSSGQFNEAAKAYSEAIDQSPLDYLLYYKRATAYYSLNRHSSALDDFDKVLELTRKEGKEFEIAWLMKSRVFLKEGSFTECRSSLDNYLKHHTQDAAAAEVKKELDESEQLAKKAENEKNAQLWNACIESASAALRTSGYSIPLRETRMTCELAAGDLEGAVGDLTRLSHLLPPSTTIQLIIARLSFLLLPSSPAAMNALKQCLHFDPDNKPCLSLHRQIKALEKGFTQMDEALGKEDWAAVIKVLTASGKNNDLLKRFDDLLKENSSREHLLPSLVPTSVPLPNPSTHSPRRQSLYRALCKSYIQSNQLRKGQAYCEDLLAMHGCSEDIDGLVGRAEGLLKKDEPEEAVRLLEKAFEASGRSSRDIHSRLQRARDILKRSKQKDYYKVLGVDRDADAQTIKKAFRRRAMTAHPDKGGSEAKMAALNEAYEVLSNPELRARFDAGDDPNDPMSQQGGQPFFFQGGGFPGGHPFGQFFQQQAGGQGGSYQFHFSGHR